MLTTFSKLKGTQRASLLQRLRHNEDGVTIIEFAMLAPAFFMFVFGLIGISMYYFSVVSLEKGIDEAARLIRTGQTQASTDTMKDFKDRICAGAVSIDCSRLEVFTNTFASWATVTPQNCITTQNDGSKKVTTNATPPTTQIGPSLGGPSQIVIVTACYRWKLANLPYFNLSNLSGVAGGSSSEMMIQAMTAFRTEPYSTSP